MAKVVATRRRACYAARCDAPPRRPPAAPGAGLRARRPGRGRPAGAAEHSARHRRHDAAGRSRLLRRPGRDPGVSVAFGTTPSHASLLTSSHAARHGVYDNESILDDRWTTLAEALRAAGYRTAAFVSASPLAGVLGLAQGFGHFDDALVFDQASGLGSYSRGQRRADVTAERFLAWLADEPAAGEPFFAWVHFYDPHQPYAPPSSPGGARVPEDVHFERPDGTPRYLRLEELDPDLAARVGRRAVERYGAEVAFLDAQIGRILDALRRPLGGREGDRPALPLYDRMIVAVVADHGENLLERGPPLALTHMAVFGGVARLPLVIKLPGSRQGGTERRLLVGNLDVAPTLLDLAGVEAPAEWTGRSFRRQLERPGSEVRSHLVLEGAEREEISIRTRKWMYREVLARGDPEVLRYLGYAEGSPVELYDLEADRGETRNLAASAPAAVARLHAIAAAFLAARDDGGAEKLLAPEHLEALRALGYVR